MSTGFTHQEVQDGVCLTTEYVPARRGVRPRRRVLAAAPGASSGQGEDEVVVTALRVLWNLARQGQECTAESTLRQRLRGHLGPGDGSRVVLDLVRAGWVTVEQTLSPVGDVRRSILRLTPGGRKVVEARFGSLGQDPRQALLAQLQSWQASCRHPRVAQLLRRQIGALEQGETPRLRTTGGEGGESEGAGEGGWVTWQPAERARRYEQVLAFFGLVGSLEEGESLDLKEVASRLFPGQVDSVKALEAVRPLLAAVARHELDCELEELGVTGDSLYSLEFCGHLAPDGGPPLWGEVPCLSTYDLHRVGRIDTTAHTLLMVENAAPLAVLARDGWGHQGYLVAYLAGMPKLAFFDFLSKLRGPGLAASLLWVDWDVGGLRILRNLLGRWPLHLPPLRVVPHPASILPHLTFSASVPSLRPAPGLRPIEVPPSYLNSGDPQVASFAATLQRYGVLYQEEVLSMYRQLLSLPP